MLTVLTDGMGQVLVGQQTSHVTVVRLTIGIFIADLTGGQG